MTKRALVLRHVSFEDLGSMAGPLDAAGYSVNYVDAATADFDALDTNADLIVILGGPIGVGDGADYPITDHEIALVKESLAANRPVLGICLGAQVIAAAMDARVYPGPRNEIGWEPLHDCTGLLAPLDGIHVLHWHCDTFDLPNGCERIASTGLTPNQAFSHGTNVLALQFHMEAISADFEHWLMGHASQIAHAGLDVQKMRADAKRFGPELEKRAAQVMTNWLANLNS